MPVHSILISEVAMKWQLEIIIVAASRSVIAVLTEAYSRKCHKKERGSECDDSLGNTRTHTDFSLMTHIIIIKCMVNFISLRVILLRSAVISA